MVVAITPPGIFGFAPPLRRTGRGGFAFRETLKGAMQTASGTIDVSATVIAPAGRDGSSPEQQRQAARRHAKALLDELQAMQRDLLRRGVAPAALRRLAALAAELVPSGRAPADLAAADPELAEICAGIVLRARVEAAKLQQRSAASGRPPAPHRPTEPDERTS